jgi:hypothetical protein
MHKFRRRAAIMAKLIGQGVEADIIISIKLNCVLIVDPGIRGGQTDDRIA